MNSIEKIEMPNIIFCEGKDEKLFLIHYLNSIELKDYPFFSNNIQVIDFGGNEELQKNLAVLKISPGFTEVKFLLIVRDAEADAEKAIKQIQNSLLKNEFPTPNGPGEWKKDPSGITVGFLLFPSCNQTVRDGTLEDLCLSILRQPNRDVITKEIQIFLEHLKENHRQTFPHEHKTKLHTYFSITDKFVGMKIGEAAATQAFDWSSDRLDFLKGFLLQMQTED